MCVCVILFEIVVITVCWKQLISAERKNVVRFDRRPVFQSVVKNTRNILWHAENIWFNCSYFKCWILFTYFLFMFFPNCFYLLYVTWNWLLSFSFISCMFCCHILFVFQKKTDSCGFFYVCVTETTARRKHVRHPWGNEATWWKQAGDRL